MSGITFDSETLQAALNKAMLEAIDGEVRTKLVADAVKHLTTAPPRGTGYYDRDTKSPLATMFNAAVESAAREIVRAELAADEKFAQQVRSLLLDAYAKMMADDSDVRKGLVDKLAESFARALTTER